MKENRELRAPWELRAGKEFVLKELPVAPLSTRGIGPQARALTVQKPGSSVHFETVPFSS
jgi:hypothetical protein